MFSPLDEEWRVQVRGGVGAARAVARRLQRAHGDVLHQRLAELGIHGRAAPAPASTGHRHSRFETTAAPARRLHAEIPFWVPYARMPYRGSFRRAHGYATALTHRAHCFAPVTLHSQLLKVWF